VLKVTQGSGKFLASFLKLDFELCNFDFHILIVVQNFCVVLCLAFHSFGELVYPRFIFSLNLLIILKHSLEISLDLAKLTLCSNAAFMVSPELVLHLSYIRNFFSECPVVLLKLSNDTFLVLNVALLRVQILVLNSKIVLGLINRYVGVLKLSFKTLNVLLVCRNYILFVSALILKILD